MPPNLLKYSNGWGHLIMSVSSQIIAVILLLQHDSTLTGVATGILVAVSGYWFISSSANAQQQIAAAQQAATIQVTQAAPAVTIAPTAPATAPLTTGGNNATQNP